MIVHEAGPLVDGVQQCIRCNVVLIDYRDCMVPDDTPAHLIPRGFPVGAFIEVEQPPHGPKYSGVVDVENATPGEPLAFCADRPPADSVVNRFCVHGRSTTAQPCPACNPLQRRG